MQGLKTLIEGLKNKRLIIAIFTCFIFISLTPAYITPDYLSLEIFLLSFQYYIALVSIGSVAIGYVFQRDVNISIDNYIKSLTENEINQDNALKLK